MIRSLPRVLLPLVALLVPVATVLCQDAPQSAPAETGGSTLSLPSLEYTSPIAFVKEYQAARVDLERVFELKGVTFDRDVFHLEMDGFLFVKSPVRGVTYKAWFVGSGKASATPPNEIERHQLKRFWKKDTLEFEFTSAEFIFAGNSEEKALTSGTSRKADEVEADVKKEKDALDGKSDKTEDEKKRLASLGAFLDRLKGYREALQKPMEEKDLQRERSSKVQEHLYAFARQLYGADWPGYWSVEMKLKLPEDLGAAAAPLTQIGFYYDPWDSEGEECGIAGTRSFGKGGDRQSTWCSFAKSDLWDSVLTYTGNSDAIQDRDLSLVHLQRYTLVNQVERGSHKFKAHQRIEMKVLKDDIRLVPIILFPLYRIKDLHFDDKTRVEVYRPENPDDPRTSSYVVALYFPDPLKAGEVKTLDITFEGDVLFYQTNGTWVIAEASQWYPQYGRLRPAYFDVTFLTPPDLTPTTAGNPQECRPEDRIDGYECHRWVPMDVTGREVPTYFMTFNMIENVKMTRGDSITPDKFPITVYANRDAEAPFAFYDNLGKRFERRFNMSKTGEEMLAIVQASMAIFDYNFGPYPFGKFDVTPHPKGYGQGGPSMLLISNFAYLTQTALQEIYSSYEAQGIPIKVPPPWNARWFIAHETAHQWWGNAVCWKSYRDQWFSEGFADYSASLVLEELDKQNAKEGNPTQWWKEFMQQELDYLIVDDRYPENIGPLVMGQRVVSSENKEGYEGYYQNYIYSKGCWVMSMLRTLFRARAVLTGKSEADGDEAFRATFQDFISTHRYGDPSTLDFQRIVQKHLGGFTEKFFRQWVYGTGIPKIEFSQRVTPAEAGKYKLEIRIRQVDTDFQFPVTLSLHYRENGEDQHKKLYRIVNKADFTDSGEIPFEPSKVVLNEDMSLLADVNEVKWTEQRADLTR